MLRMQTPKLSPFKIDMAPIMALIASMNKTLGLKQQKPSNPGPLLTIERRRATALGTKALFPPVSVNKDAQPLQIEEGPSDTFGEHRHCKELTC